MRESSLLIPHTGSQHEERVTSRRSKDKMKEYYAVLYLSAFTILVGMAGCAIDPKEAFGRTYYIDGRAIGASA